MLGLDGSQQVDGAIANGVSTGKVEPLDSSTDIVDQGTTLVVKHMVSTELLDVVKVLGRRRRHNLVAGGHGQLDCGAANSG